jgi:hypothetical protein
MLPHHYKPGPLQVAHDAQGGDSHHILVGVVFSLATLKPERERDRLGETYTL